MSYDELSSQEIADRLRAAVTDVFAVQDVTLSQEPRRGVRLRGRLTLEAARAYERVAPRFRELGYTALFRREKDLDVILALPGSLPVAKARLWLAGLLFLATVLSVLFVGAQLAGEPEEGFRLLDGWPFAASLLAILLAHELGHYTVARFLGTPVSLPYFMPVPLPPFGTMGAFIRMQAPPINRRRMLAIAVAGPLSGLVLAVPILILGLSLSEVRPIPPLLPGQTMYIEGNSLLYIALKVLLFGRILPSRGMDVFLHPVAFAGWAGLLVSGLNLIPAGQLDGGHIIYTLLGERRRYLTWVVILALIGLGWLWQGWWLWALLITVFGQSRAAPLDDITRLDPPLIALALLVLFIFLLIFTPIPLRLIGGVP
jgi:membrane-associated protease RseP (regulator of RpoE activity)